MTTRTTTTRARNTNTMKTQTTQTRTRTTRKTTKGTRTTHEMTAHTTATHSTARHATPTQLASLMNATKAANVRGPEEHFPNCSKGNPSSDATDSWKKREKALSTQKYHNGKAKRRTTMYVNMWTSCHPKSGTSSHPLNGWTY